MSRHNVIPLGRSIFIGQNCWRYKRDLLYYYFRTVLSFPKPMSPRPRIIDHRRSQTQKGICEDDLLSCFPLSFHSHPFSLDGWVSTQFCAPHTPKSRPRPLTRKDIAQVSESQGRLSDKMGSSLSPGKNGRAPNQWIKRFVYIYEGLQIIVFSFLPSYPPCPQTL